MLRILGSGNPFAHPLHRREVMRVGAAAALGLSLPAWLQCEQVMAGSTPIDTTFGRAKRVLLLYLQGAASQFETWDPKPDAPAEIRGPWGVAATSIPGVSICEKLPKMSRLMDQVSIVRSMSHEFNNHSNHYTLTGYPTIDFTSETSPHDSRHHPFFGSVLDYLEDGRNPHARLDVPRNIGLPWPFSQYSPVFRRAGPYGAFLGAKYDPVWTEFDGTATKKVGRVSFFDQFNKVEVSDPFLGIDPAARLRVSSAARLRDELTLDRFDRRRSLLEQMDAERQRLTESDPARNLDRFQSMAHAMITSERIRVALDVGREPTPLREEYGLTLFGQSVLTARRLLESGARIVSVFWDEYKVVNTAWDTHFDHATRLGDELLPGFDAAVSTLLRDLAQRNMLDDTLVLCLTEHGRTPRMSEEQRGGGRDHWSQAYSVLLAGGGIARGSVLGASDRQGAFVKEHPISPQDILATMYHLMGIPPETTIPDRLQRPVPLVAHGSVVRDLLN